MFIYHDIYPGKKFKQIFDEYGEAVKQKKYLKTDYNTWTMLKHVIEKNPYGNFIVTYNLTLRTISIRCCDWCFGKFNVSALDNKDFFDFFAIRMKGSRILPSYIETWETKIKVPLVPSFSTTNFDETNFTLNFKDFLSLCKFFSSNYIDIETLIKELDITFCDFPEDSLNTLPLEFRVFVDKEENFYCVSIKNTEIQKNICTFKIGTQEAVLPVIRTYFSPDRMKLPTVYYLKLTSEEMKRFYDAMPSGALPYAFEDYFDMGNTFRVTYCNELHSLSIATSTSDNGTYTNNLVYYDDVIFKDLIRYVRNNTNPVNFVYSDLPNKLRSRISPKPILKGRFYTLPIRLNLNEFFSLYNSDCFPALRAIIAAFDFIYKDFYKADMPNDLFFYIYRVEDIYTLYVEQHDIKLFEYKGIITADEVDKFLNKEKDNEKMTYMYDKGTVDDATVSAGNMTADTCNPFGDIEFGPLNGSHVALSPYGLAVYRPADGKWVSYDKEKNSIFDTSILHFKVPNLLYLVPAPLDKVQAGDMIMHLGHMCFVTCVSEQASIDVVDPLNGEYRCILPAKSPFGFDFVTKVINLFDYKSADADHPFGDMLPLMMMAQSGGLDNNAMLAMMMMGDHGTAYDDMMPFLLMSQSGGGANANLPMLFWMMNKKRG